MIYQKEISLGPFPRGFHLITRDIESALQSLLPNSKNGLCHIFLKHTSASLTINENADPDVRYDLENYLNRIAPERDPHYRHTLEGPDDMPAHIKSSLLGVSLIVPITNGRLNLGTWQGIYLCEYRNHGGKRKLVITVI
ncbi:MAG: YjbQ family protein [Candidatus Hydrogenedentota bacterium]|nr:MAG: YjbQ family protein [Candidatus Hydrogenedentota bacterium]